MGEVNRVEINAPTETENITLEQEAEMKAVEQQETAEDSSESNQLEGEERPEWLDDKFKTPEDLAKAYSELEKKMSNGAEDQKEESGEEGDSEATPESDNVITNATLEYEETGELSSDTFKSLEDAGLPKEYVESFIAGQEALAEQQATELQAEVGGKEQYEGMVSWAAENLPDADLDTFNSLVTKGSPEERRLAVKGLYAQYVGHGGGGSPALKQGNTSGNSIRPFSSTAELQRAMSDRRYEDVPSYREEVEKRLAVSSIL
jgi:hypothetical protein